MVLAPPVSRLAPPSAHPRFTTRTNTHGRKREVESDGARLRSMGNCTMPADTPPISEHQLCSTPLLCSTLIAHARSRIILKSNGPPQRSRFQSWQIYAINSMLSACIFFFYFFFNKITPARRSAIPPLQSRVENGYFYNS